MAYGILRVRNLHYSDLGNCEKHNRRLFDGKIPENIDPRKADLNEHHIQGDKTSYREALDHRLQNIAVRKNSVVAIEFVLGASREFYKGNYIATSYLSNCVAFLAEKYGRQNIISIDKHFDESNPHVHVLVAPISSKVVKWKNKNGAGTKTEERLCARDITGGPDKLRTLQTEFFEYIKPYGLKAGVEFYRGTFAEAQLKVYAKRTDHRLVKISKTLALVREEQGKEKQRQLQLQVLEEMKALAKDQDEIRQLEKNAEGKKKRNSRGGWKKGFNPWS